MHLALSVLAEATGGDDAEPRGKVAGEVDEDRRRRVGEADIEQEGRGLCVCDGRLQGVGERRGDDARLLTLNSRRWKESVTGVPKTSYRSNSSMLMVSSVAICGPPAWHLRSALTEGACGWVRTFAGHHCLHALELHLEVVECPNELWIAFWPLLECEVLDHVPHGTRTDVQA